jgi:hypothetical protein
VRKARQLKTASQINQWLSSPALQPPNAASVGTSPLLVRLMPAKFRLSGTGPTITPLSASIVGADPARRTRAAKATTLPRRGRLIHQGF